MKDRNGTIYVLSPVFTNALQTSMSSYFVDFEGEECFSQRLEKNTVLTVILS